MFSTKIHCVVIRVPADDQRPASSQPRRSRHDALPWADPYILELIAKLQREVKAERAARARSASQGGMWDFAEKCSDLAAVEETCAGKVPPPPATAVAAFFADDEDEREFPEDQPDFSRLPR
jgi:hypothetical protein